MYKLVVVVLALAASALADTQVVKSTVGAYPYLSDSMLKTVVAPSIYPSAYVSPAVSGYTVPQYPYQQYSYSAQYPTGYAAYPSGYYPGYSGYNGVVAPAVHAPVVSAAPAYTYGSQYVMPKTPAATHAYTHVL